MLDLAAAITAVRAMHFRGINLTMPHKISVIPMLDMLTPAAEIIGAVNTVVNDDGKLTGENTDGKGFTASLIREGVALKDSRITLLGAGGAARAIAVECALAGASAITIINRNAARGQDLADLLFAKTEASAVFLPWEGRVRVPEGTDILINATPVGLMPDSDSCPDIDYASIHPGMMVSDVVFNPVDPLFLQKARQMGARTFSGTGMLVQQAALNFELWTGVKAPLELMDKTLRRAFAGGGR